MIILRCPSVSARMSLMKRLNLISEENGIAQST
jgi:hypothetical protein